MATFLVKREDGHFLNVTPATIAALPTAELVREDGWGILRLRHAASGDVVVIDDEMPGLRLWFEGGKLDDATQARIATDIGARLAAATGHPVITIPIG